MLRVGVYLYITMYDFDPLEVFNDHKAIASVGSFNETIVTTLIGVVQVLLILGGMFLFNLFFSTYIRIKQWLPQKLE